jgi:tetratricopeptide (TPR) repeat protein
MQTGSSRWPSELTTGASQRRINGLPRSKQTMNLRAALDHLSAADPERQLQLAGALAWFWQARSSLVEGREQLTAAIASSPDDPPRMARARALSGAAGLLAWQGDKAGAIEFWRQALRVWRQVDDKAEIALALEGAGWAEFLAGADEQACATFEECLAIQRASANPHLVNRAMVALGQALVALNRVDQAQACADEILRFSRIHHNTRSEHSGRHYLADCALIEGKCVESLQAQATRGTKVALEECGPESYADISPDARRASGPKGAR